MIPLKWTAIVPLIIAVLGIGSCSQAPKAVDLSNYNMEQVSADDLENWSFYGLGKAFKSGSAQFCIAENDSTFGAMIVSPESYTGDVIIRYNVLSLTSSTVLVAMISASDLDSSTELTIPESYDGRMSLWTNEKDNYFFAFRNAPHNRPPFLRKYPVPGNEALATAAENIMFPGNHYEIELGRIENRLWLSVNGEKILETIDNDILPGGHIAFRVRGTANFKAACLIKDLTIYSE
jgi:hypothetical protein